MENAQPNCGQTFFRGRMSKVLRLSIRDLPSFASKSPATLSILSVTPKHSTATQNAIDYVKGLLLQSSHALSQNQKTIKELLAERDKLQSERDSRPTLEEYQLLQEQLDAQREISRMDRAQIKHLHAVSEQHDRIIFQTELRFHDVNQAKNELASKVRSLSAAQTESSAKVMALERQLQMSKDEINILTEELRNKADDLQSCHERLQVSMAVQNELKEKVMLSLNDPRTEEITSLDCEAVLKSLYYQISDNAFEKNACSPSSAEILERLRSSLTHYQELRNSSADTLKSHLKKLFLYIPGGGLIYQQNDLTALVDLLEKFIREVQEHKVSRADNELIESECSILRSKVKSTEAKLDEVSSKLAASEISITDLRKELKTVQSQKTALSNDLEQLRSESVAFKQQNHSSPVAATNDCLSCPLWKKKFGTLEKQLILLSQEFESLQRDMVEMRSRATAHISVIKDKDMCIAKLQEDIRVLSGPQIICTSTQSKENRDPLTPVNI